MFIKSYRDKRTRDTFLQIDEGATITVYDTETTGLDKATDEIIQFAAKKYVYTNDEWITGPEINLLIKPRKPIPPEVSAKNHITNEMVENCPYIEDVLPDINAIMDTDFWCGHNIIGFDNQFMKRTYEAAEHPLPEGFFYSLDTLDAVVDIVERKDCGKYNLGSMCDYFGIEESTEGTAGFHDALYDVRQCAELAKTVHKLYQEYRVPEVEGYTDPTIIPTIYKIIPFKAFERAYTKGNYFLIKTDCGTARYDRYNQTWDWGKDSPTKAVSLQNVIEATYAKMGFNSDHDLLFWKPEPEQPKMSKSELEDYLSHPKDWLISFGKYKGKTLASLISDAEGIDYLKYMVTTEWLNDEKRKVELAIITAALKE